MITHYDPAEFLAEPPEMQRLIWRLLTKQGKIALVKALITRRKS